MPFMIAAKNSMLGAVGITHVSLHSAFPGTTGLNELSGGGYARAAISFAAAANGILDSSNQPQMNVPADTTVRYIGFWNASSGGSFRGYQAVGGSPKRVASVNTTSEVITSPGHGFSDGWQVAFVGGTPPGGLAEGTAYFVVGATADTFQVSNTSGGAAINLTSGPGTAQVTRIRPEVFSGAGTFTVVDVDLDLNGL